MNLISTLIDLIFGITLLTRTSISMIKTKRIFELKSFFVMGIGFCLAASFRFYGLQQVADRTIHLALLVFVINLLNNPERKWRHHK